MLKNNYNDVCVYKGENNRGRKKLREIKPLDHGDSHIREEELGTFSFLS